MAKETTSDPIDYILPSAKVELYEGIRFGLVATKKVAIPPLFVK